MLIRSIAAGAVALALAGPVAAQGTKEPSNFGAGTMTKRQDTDTAQRPTTIQNVPTNMLPSGTGVQRVYRDGKLQTIVR